MSTADQNMVLVRSGYVTLFEHMGDIYAYHDLFGYILRMSQDVADLIDAFASPQAVVDVVQGGRTSIEPSLAQEFVSVLLAHSCLIPVGTDERDQVFDMYPFHGPWVLVHRKAPKEASLLTSRLGDVVEETLTGWTLAFWDAADGNRTVREASRVAARTISNELLPDDEEVLATVARFVHHDRQFLRLSHHPARMYQGPLLPVPAYLRSTMPYRVRGTAPTRPIAEQRRVSASSHYAGDSRRPYDRFDVDETTLSHLFREPHPALDGRTFGEALLDLLASAGALGESGGRILEVGGGTGALGAGLVRAFNARWPGAVKRLSWTTLDLSPALLSSQGNALAQFDIQHDLVASDVESADFEPGTFDLVLCNEMIGDLTVLRLSRQEARRLLLGKGVRGVPQCDADLLRRHPAVLRSEDLPDEFHLNVGAFRLIESLARWLAPGGFAWVSEFGDEHRFPVLSDHLDHPEFSIHFGHLRKVAEDVGLSVRYGEVLDLLGFRRDVEVLASTRGQFLALRSLASRHGARIEKLAYTRDSLAAALGPHLPLQTLEGLHLDKVGHRVMGLSPGDFKALLLHKPMVQAH